MNLSKKEKEKEKEKEDKSGTEDLLKIDTAISSIARSRKRNTDSKEFVPLLTLFRILEPLQTKPTASIRAFCRDVVKHFFQQGEQICVCTQQKTVEETWLVVEGKVIFTDDDPDDGSCRILNVGDCFGSPNSVFKEYLTQPNETKRFSAKARTRCILLSIDNSKMSKLFQLDEIQEQMQKRALICRSLSLHTSGNTIKSFVKKFVLRKVCKSTMLTHEGQKEQNLIVVAHGDVELTKTCLNSHGQKVRLRIGIVTQGSFANDYSFFRQPEITCGKYTVEAVTEAQIYELPKADLFKYFYDLPTLWPSVAAVCQEKHKLREEFILRNLQKRFSIQAEQSFKDLINEHKKHSNGVRREISSQNDDFIMESVKYEQLVQSKEKIVKPLLLKEFRTGNKKISQVHSGQLKKIIKKQKMDIMKVRNLVDNRIRGIRSDDVHIQLKPTLFNDRLKYEEILDQVESIVVTTPMNLSPSKGNRRKGGFSSRENKSKQNDREKDRYTTHPSIRAMSAKLRKRPRNFKMVAPPRQHFQSFINRSTDPYVFVRCETGKARKVRAIF